MVKAESKPDTSSDDAVKKLKEKRLEVKDKIVKQLQAHPDALSHRHSVAE